MAHLDRRERHVFENGLVGEQVERLEHHADLGTQAGKLLAFLRQRLAVDADIARIGGLQTIEGAAHRGLAGTGRTDDDEYLTLLDGEIDVLQDVQVTIVLLDMGQFDEWTIADFGARHQRALCCGFVHIRHNRQV